MDCKGCVILSRIRFDGWAGSYLAKSKYPRSGSVLTSFTRS